MWTHDIRFAVRLLRQNWGFSAIVILILALCIGANSAVLSIVNAALVRPLPYPDPKQLQHVVTVSPSNPSPVETTVDGTTWQLVRDHVPALQVAVYGSGPSSGVNVVVKNTGIFTRQGRVSSGFFGVLGIRPFIGREFSPEEDRANGPNAVILSHRLWLKYFGGDPRVLGTSILVVGASYTVVGVMPEQFEWGGDDDLWTPLRPSTTGEGQGTNYGIIARLRPGATLEQGKVQMATATEEARRRSLSLGSELRVRLELVPLQQAVTETVRRPLRILWLAVAGIFLLGCVNIGGMLVARVSGRSNEFSTRLALGATPQRIIVQVLLESIVLSLIGGVVGLGLGYLALSALRDLGRDAFPFLQFVDLDRSVVAATFFLMLLASVAFGLLPAWHAARSDQRFAQGGSRTVAGRGRHFSLGATVATQVTLAIALLMAATLLLRTFVFLWNLPAGFDSSGVLTGQFSLQDAHYGSTLTVTQLFDRVFAHLHETPGIEAVACALTLPYEQALNSGFRLPGEAQPNLTDETYVTPEYFDTLRIPVLEGRSFSASDGPDTPPVVIVNRAFADRYLKRQGLQGADITMGGVSRQVIGVVGNTAGGRPGWGNFAPIGDFPIVYIPARQIDSESMVLVHVWFSPSWIVRSRLPEHEVVQRLTDAIRSVDPLLPPPKFRSFRDLKVLALGEQRLLASLVDVLAGLAILLAALGIYGLATNLVLERTRELGIRIALGSTASRAAWTALTPGIRWVSLGAAAGSVITFSFERLLRSFLWGIRLNDPLTLLVVGLGFLAVTAISSLIPAVRVLRIHPADTLRAQ